MAEEVRQLPMERIRPSAYQPRHRFDEAMLEELAVSIRAHGIIQPIIVRPCGAVFELIAGERRFRAAQKAGLVEVPAIVRSFTNEQALEAMLVENLQREDLSVVEAARAYHQLGQDFGYSHGEIAQRTGKSRVAVANTLRLLQLPQAVLDSLDRGDLTEGHARALLALPYPSLQTEVAEWIVRNGMSVREAEQKIRKLLQQAPPARTSGGKQGPTTDPYLSSLEERLRGRFGTKARVAYQEGQGAVTLEFYTDEDLARILELLGVKED